MASTSEQTAAHSSDHGRNADSVGARSGYRPDPQATLRQPHQFYAAAFNNCDQVEVETSELEEVGSMSEMTRSKRRSAVDADGGRPGRATFGAQRGDVLSSEANNKEPVNAATTADAMKSSEKNTDCEAQSEDEPQCSRRSEHTSCAVDVRLNEEPNVSSEDDSVHVPDDSRWQYCDSEVAIRRTQSQVQQSHVDSNRTHCQLPSTSQVPNSSANIEHEIERLSRETSEIADSLPERHQLVQQLSGNRVGQTSAQKVKDEISKSVSSRTGQIHSSVRDRFSRPTSLEKRRGKASADGQQLAKAGHIVKLRRNQLLNLWRLINLRGIRVNLFLLLAGP